MRGGVLALVLVVAALAAGCVTPTPGIVSASEAPTSGGSGSATLTIHVTDEPHGPPLAGAQVIVTTVSTGWWGDETREELTLSTDANGDAVAHLPAGSEAHVVASLAGYTRETKTDLSADGSVEIPLYRSHVTLWLNGSLSPAAVSLHRAGANDFRWDPQAIQFGGTSEAQRGYAARVVLLNLTLDWTNTPTAAGDLGIGVGQETRQPDVVQDANAAQLPPGHYEETMALTVSDVHRERWNHASALYAGAGTGTAYVAPSGLPYTMRVDATFDGDQALRDSPGFNQVWGVLVAFVAAAVVLRRR